ncbi:MAG: M36 family metallopeptidase [Pyrinomonadaceae bacterium]
MKSNAKRTSRETRLRLALVAVVWSLVIGAVVWQPWTRSAKAAIDVGADPTAAMYRRSAPQFDLNISRALPNVRQATGDQLQALNRLKAAAGAPNMTARWNDFGGSPDVMYDFASQPFQGTPEEAGRAFINQNAALFGVSESNNVRLFSQTDALGGKLLRFQQTFNGIPVTNGGIGIVLNANNQVVMASGPFFRDVAVNTQPTLSAEQARAAADADLARFAADVPAAVADLLRTGLDILTQQVGNAANVEPRLGIYPTADGYRLVWKVGKFSTNPFGLYVVSVDAHTGEVVQRHDYVTYQTNQVLPFTADIYPKYPRITQELKDQGIISVCGDRPCDQVRAQLRKFDPSNVTTGVNGTLTGTHTVVNNALATKQPFAQAARGTWHFAKNDPVNFEGRTNEQDHFAEPAEHQDEINAFFFTTYLLEYVDHLHRAGDPGTFGSTGAFPDQYPNSSTPLPATVHIPDVLTPLAGRQYPPVTDPEFAQKVLGLDNAFALNLTPFIEGITGEKSPVVVNPTAYGHGFLFNDTALEGTVPYHEGMHAITSPIAGLEGIEGGGLNEGQADMWAFTITDNPSLGDYVINGYRLRQRYRELNRDPDSIGYIRSANSSLKYSDIATYRNPANGQYEYEEHRDGEIYMSTMWDLRQMLNRMYPQNTQFKRPQPSDGAPAKAITKGTNIFERLFLGSMYVLGTTAPDTFVKARDALVVADQLLYPTDSTDSSAPGKHRALIEQLFAAKELGVNARESLSGVPTISTQVTSFAGSQAAPAVPTGVQVAPASTKTLRVSWSPVSGAFAYEVLKRKTQYANQREPNGVRAVNDGDSSTTGYRHVAYVNGSQTSYIDEGKVQGIFTPAGISNLFDSEYVVRAIGVNASGQVGFSDMSGSSKPSQGRQDLTSQVDSAISNISFVNGVMAFDNRLTNARGAFSSDKTIYQPLEFQIVSISNPTVTVRNADANGNTFVYNQTLALGQTSAAKRLEFNDPAAQMFSFDARVYGNAYIGSTVGTGTSGNDGTGTAPGPVTYSLYNQSFTGTLLLGDPVGIANNNAGATWGNPTFKGITWDDFPITTKSDAIALEARLSSSTAVDLDFELRTTSGQVLQRSADFTANEFVSAAVQPNTTYILRVLGFANGPAAFNIATTQLLPNGSPNENGGTRTTGGSPLGVSAITTQVSGLYRFTVNPITRSVTVSLLR